MGLIPNTGIKLLMLSLFRPSIFPVAGGRENVFISLKKFALFA
jgi:hypothetical protein